MLFSKKSSNAAELWFSVGICFLMENEIILKGLSTGKRSAVNSVSQSCLNLFGLVNRAIILIMMGCGSRSVKWALFSSSAVISLGRGEFK